MPWTDLVACFVFHCYGACSFRRVPPMVQRSYDFRFPDGEEVTKYNTTKVRSRNICLDLSLRKVCGGKKNERDMMVNGS